MAPNSPVWLLLNIDCFKHPSLAGLVVSLSLSFEFLTLGLALLPDAQALEDRESHRVTVHVTLNKPLESTV